MCVRAVFVRWLSDERGSARPWYLRARFACYIQILRMASNQDHGMSAQWPWLPMLALLSVAGSAVSAESSTSEGDATTKGSVLLFGSSSMNDSFGHLIAEDLGRNGFQVDRHGYASAGLARPDFVDLRGAIDQLLVEKNSATVLLYVGANDAQSLWLRPEERPRDVRDRAAWVRWDDERWSSIYESRVSELLRAVCVRGARRAIVLSPVDVTNEHMQARLARIRHLQEHATLTHHCARFVSTAGDTEDFVMIGEPLRAVDGFHMSYWGAMRVWQRVRDRILSLVGERD
jgi:hypothetical protein